MRKKKEYSNDEKPSIKLFLKRTFCKHKNFSYYTKISKFHNIQGEVVYKICDNCGMIIGTEFYNNEEFMASFKYK